jgi:hypothetical protein
VTARPGAHIKHPPAAELQRQLLQRRELVGPAEEVGDGHIVALEVVIHHEDGIVLPTEIGLHGGGVRLPGIQIHSLIFLRCLAW